jgi:hypothetical protein
MIQFEEMTEFVHNHIITEMRWQEKETIIEREVPAP